MLIMLEISTNNTVSVGRDRSPSCHGENHTSPRSPRKHKPALRQPSYLTAIHSPQSAGRILLLVIFCIDAITANDTGLDKVMQKKKKSCKFQ